MTENYLCDIFRIRNPQEWRFTWRNKNPFKQRRLNFFLISDSLQELVMDSKIIPSVQSGHSAIVLKLSPTNEGERGRSYWKFNNSLLDDNHFIEGLKQKIQVYLLESSEVSTPNARWDYLKYCMRQFSKEFSIDKAKKRKARRLELESKVKEFEEQLTTASNDQLINDENKCKEELESLYGYLTDGIILRSHATWYEKDEKSTKYFLNLEKRNKTRSHILKNILANIKSCYSKLYTRRSVKTEKEIFDYLYDLNIPKLSHEAITSCEGKLTVKECWNMLDSMGNNKSRGNDGFTKEFYLAFLTI